MELSKTTEANEWLAQFDSDDILTASLLLDSIRFASAEEVTTGIREQLEAVLNNGEFEPPYVIAPIVSIEDMGLSKDDEPCVFENFDPLPKIASSPGSEAPVANIIREATKPFDKCVIKEPNSIENLRKQKVRTLIFVTDFSGSGTQVERYLDAWYRNRTIKSWKSSGYLKFVVVAFATTLQAKLKIEEHRTKPTFHVLEVVPTLKEIATRTGKEKLVELCKLYANRNNMKAPLGYGESACLFATALSVPNNLPAILIKGGKGQKGWKAFFPNRTSPANLTKQIRSHRPGIFTKSILENPNAQQLVNRFREDPGQKRWEKYLIALAICSDNQMMQAYGGYPEAIGLLSGINRQQTTKLIEVLHRFGWVEKQGRLTGEGRRVLKHHAKKLRKITTPLARGESPYYPLLKGGEGIST